MCGFAAMFLIVFCSVGCLGSAKSSVTWSSSINSILQSRSLLPDFERQDDGNSILHSLTAGAQLALEHCQQEFKWERWNCPDSVFSRKSRQLLTKEAAFVSAMTAAGIIFSVAQDCARGHLRDCGCRNSTQYSQRTCLDNLVYAEKVAAEFLQALERDSRDTLAAINLHNYIAGKEAVRESVRQDCRCQGLSSFCSHKVCHTRLAPFKDITSQLRQSYDAARMVDWNSVMTDPSMLTADQLLYMVQSPDYCQPNNTTDWPGTAGRVCSRARGPGISMRQRRSCKELCRSCGHSVRRRQRTITSQCKCTFHWCCSVSCEQCSKSVQQHFCE